MVRAAALSAASALCLIWIGGCASTSEPAAKTASVPPAATAAPAGGEANSNLSTQAKDLPTTLDGEIRRAQLLREKGDYDEAARSLAQIMLIAPDDARVVGEYGKVLEQQGHSQDALAFLKRAVALQPRDWSLQSALGVAYDQIDDHASAKAAYERALALKPGDASVLNNYAVSRMLAGDYAAAQRLFAQAEARGISNPKIALNLEKLASLNVARPEQPVAAAPEATSKSTSPVKMQMQAQAPALHSPAAPTMPVPAVQVATINPSTKTVATAAAVPKAGQQGPMTKSGLLVASRSPKPLGPQVVMERVPIDPLAGPVAHRKPAATKLASTAHPPQKPAAQKPGAQPPPTPSLRTAADSN